MLYGKYPAIVTMNEPMTPGIPFPGCIKVVCPALLGYKTLPIPGMPWEILKMTMVESEWVKPSFPNPQDMNLPGLGESVWVEVQGGGTINQLIYSGFCPGNFFMNQVTKMVSNGAPSSFSLATDRVVGVRNGSYLKMEDTLTGKVILECQGATMLMPVRVGATLELDSTMQKVSLINQDPVGATKDMLELSATGVSLIDRLMNSIAMGATGLTFNDALGNTIEIKKTGIAITDMTGNTIELSPTGVGVTDVAGNEIATGPSGITITDMSGNSVQLGPMGVTIKTGDAALWKPNILPVCCFTGAPHGGAGAGVVKMKGA